MLFIAPSIFSEMKMKMLKVLEMASIDTYIFYEGAQAGGAQCREGEEAEGGRDKQLLKYIF